MARSMKNALLQFADIAPRALAAWQGASRLHKSLIVSTIAGTILLIASLAPKPYGMPLSPEFFVTVAQNPARLSEEDVAHYKTAFGAAEMGDFQTVADSINKVKNPRLVGHLLARHYLSATYMASATELTDWLAAYSDHPEAKQIQTLAVARGIKAPAIDAEKPLKGSGYAEHLGRTTMPDGWYQALGLWRSDNAADALPLFAAIGADKELSGWQRAAGHYWAYRAASKMGDGAQARDQLKQAASFKTTFYGLLAIQQMGASLPDASAPRVSAGLRNNPQAIRAALFAQLGHTEEAEIELRHLYSAVDKSERAGIITLAQELNLANLQVRLANLSELSAEEELFASYPVPQYVLDAQAAQRPSILLAIARNESGFRETAASGAGAVGLMQILPSTAHSIERRVGRDALQVASTSDVLEPMAERLNDPATSVRYSAQYLNILAQEKAVGKNLVRILAAYNAGPGTVAGWQSMAGNISDPLLYIESIPYPETRNYVMQVLAHSWIYASLLGESPDTLRQLASGNWPLLG